MTNSLGLLELCGEQIMVLRDQKIGTFSPRFVRGTEIVLKLEGSNLSFFADGHRYNCPELDACSFSGTYRFGISLCHEGQEVAITNHSSESSSEGEGAIMAALLLAALSNDSSPMMEYRPGSDFQFHDWMISGIGTKAGGTVAYSNERIRATLFTKEVFEVPTSSPVSITFRVNQTNHSILVCGILSADSRGKHFFLGEDEMRDSVGIVLLRDKVAAIRNGLQIWTGTLAQPVGPGSIVTMTVQCSTLSFNVDGSSGQDISLTLSGQCRFGVSFSDDDQEFEITPFAASPPRSTQPSPTVSTPSPPAAVRSKDKDDSLSRAKQSELSPLYKIVAEGEYDFLDESRVPYTALSEVMPLKDGWSPSIFHSAYFHQPPAANQAQGGAAEVMYSATVKRIRLVNEGSCIVPEDESIAVKKWSGLRNSILPQRRLRNVILGLQTPRDSQFICPTLAWCTKPGDRSAIYAIMPAFDSDLYQYMVRLNEYHTEGGDLPEFGVLGKEMFALIAKDIVRGMCELRRGLDSKAGAVHRDLRLKNIFLTLIKPGDSDFTGSPKSDLQEEAAVHGELQRPLQVRLAAIGDVEVNRDEVGGPIILERARLSYQAPELDVRLTESVSILVAELACKTEIFSVGTLLWSMLHFPKELPEIDLRDARSNYPLRCDPRVPSPLAHLIGSCTDYSAKLRPSFNAVQEHLDHIFDVRSGADIDCS